MLYVILISLKLSIIIGYIQPQLQYARVLSQAW